MSRSNTKLSLPPLVGVTDQHVLSAIMAISNWANSIEDRIGSGGSSQIAAGRVGGVSGTGGGSVKNIADDFEAIDDKIAALEKDMLESSQRVFNDPLWLAISSKVELISDPITVIGSVDQRIDEAVKGIIGPTGVYTLFKNGEFKDLSDAQSVSAQMLNMIATGSRTTSLSSDALISSVEKVYTALTPGTGSASLVDKVDTLAARTNFTDVNGNAITGKAYVDTQTTATVNWATGQLNLKTDVTKTSNMISAIGLNADGSKTGDSVISQLTTLDSTVSAPGTGLVSQISQLNTTVGNQSTTLQIHASSINGLGAQYAVTIDANGYISGYGLANGQVGNGSYSRFYVNADTFAVGRSGADKSTSILPFIVEDGIVKINTAHITALNAGKITSGTIAAVGTVGGAVSITVANGNTFTFDTLIRALNTSTNTSGNWQTGFVGSSNSSRGVGLLGNSVSGGFGVIGHSSGSGIGGMFANSSLSGTALQVEGVTKQNGNLDVTGAVLATQNITAYSDRRVKKNLQVIDSALDRVKKLTGYTYDRTDIKLRQTGLIAQDVLEVLPEAVSSFDGMLALNYGAMMGLMVEAIKELEQRLA